MHPRVHRPPTSNVDPVVSFAPEADGRIRNLEKTVAAVTSELNELRRERDDLEVRLRAALDELAAVRTTVRPPPDAVITETSQARRIAPVDVFVVEPAIAEVIAVPRAAEPEVAAEALAVPSLRSTTTHGAELSRLVVSTRPAAPSKTDAPPSSGANRRHRERRECEFDVEFLGDSHFITGITQDLSVGGVFVATYQLLPIGTAVTIAFELPDGHRIEASGEVRWTRQEREEAGTRPGLGIAFTDLDPESVAKITEFCAGLPARYYEF